MFSKNFGIVLACLFLFSCSKKANEIEDSFEGASFPIRSEGDEFQIPSRLWDLLLKSETKAKKEGQEEQALTTASFLYAPIEVWLKEKTEGVLMHPEVRLQLADGGGDIDLSRWTTGKNGTFFVNFSWGGRQIEATESRVFFYSRSKKRRVGGEIVGSGCRQILDVGKYLLSIPLNQGMAVNTTRSFHSSVLGGHFLFSWMSEGRRKVTHVTFLDSKNPQFECEKEK